MIQALETYGLIYFKYQHKLRIRGLDRLSSNTASKIRKWIKNNKQSILQDAPTIMEENQETGEVIVYDSDLGIRIFFDPPLEGPKVDSNRWEKVYNS